MSKANPQISADVTTGRLLDPTNVVGSDTDPFGPARILEFENPILGARAIYVSHNVSRGPAIGGIRFASDVTAREVYELARAMTFKNAAALIPHGGAKSSIVANPVDFPQGSEKRRALVEWFADCLAPYAEYIPGPDMFTDERDMDALFQRIGRSIGRTGIIPLDRLGLTALGVMHSLRVLVEGGYVAGLSRIDGLTMSIEGFGNVGSALSLFARESGARLVAASDFPNPSENYGGVVYCESGLDVDKLVDLKNAGLSIVDTDQPGVQIFKGRAELKRLFSFPVDVLVPAARTNSVDLETARNIDARLVLEAANGPLTSEAERHMFERGVQCGVDYLVNCGGVIGGAEEWAELKQPLGTLRIPHCIARILDAVTKNIPAVYDLARARNITPREAAFEIVAPRIG